MWGYAALSGAIAALATLLELDRTFYTPKKWGNKLPLWAWWAVYTLANAALAGAIFIALTEHPQWRIFAHQGRFVRAVAVGTGYLAFVHLSFSDVVVKGQTVAFGPQFIYDQAKEAVYRRINGKATDALLSESRTLANGKTLEALCQDAKERVNADNLFTSQEKLDHIDWLTRVSSDEHTSEAERSMQIAAFILRGDRPGG
jgi:hypothetical protein